MYCVFILYVLLNIPSISHKSKHSNHFHYIIKLSLLLLFGLDKMNNKKKWYHGNRLWYTILVTIIIALVIAVTYLGTTHASCEASKEDILNKIVDIQKQGDINTQTITPDKEPIVKDPITPIIEDNTSLQLFKRVQELTFKESSTFGWTCSVISVEPDGSTFVMVGDPGYKSVGSIHVYKHTQDKVGMLQHMKLSPDQLIHINPLNAGKWLDGPFVGTENEMCYFVGDRFIGNIQLTKRNNFKPDTSARKMIHHSSIGDSDYMLYVLEKHNDKPEYRLSCNEIMVKESSLINTESELVKLEGIVNVWDIIMFSHPEDIPLDASNSLNLNISHMRGYFVTANSRGKKITVYERVSNTWDIIRYPIKTTGIVIDIKLFEHNNIVYMIVACKDTSNIHTSCILVYDLSLDLKNSRILRAPQPYKIHRIFITKKGFYCIKNRNEVTEFLFDTQSCTFINIKEVVICKKDEFITGIYQFNSHELGVTTMSEEKTNGKLIIYKHPSIITTT